MTIVTKTKRLILRRFEATDAPGVTELIGNWNVCSMLSRVPYPYTLEMAEQWIDQQTTNPDLICAIEMDGTFMGCVAQEQEFGYWLGEPYWGQGIMTEAARGLLGFLFQEELMHDLIAGYYEDNPASGKVLRHCGFQETGKSPTFCLARNEEVTRIDMALNRHQFEDLARSW